MTEKTDITTETPERLSIAGLPLDVQKDLQNIFDGHTLPSLYSDIIAKTIFHADLHPDRLNFLLRGIAKDETIDVDRSAGNESVKQSLNSKGMIYDIAAWLKDLRMSDLGIQKAAQDFLFTRVDLYGSDMLLLQYQVEAGQAKSELNYQNVNDVLIVVLMVESPKAFREFDSVSDCYIHRFEKMVADTGLTYTPKVKTMYVQLDKCLEQFRSGYNSESEDHQPDELQRWLAMIADINDLSVAEAVKTDEELLKIRAEVHSMAQDKEVQNMIIQERYDRMDVLTYGSEREAAGEERGKINTLLRLLKNGRITVEEAAEDCNMSVKDFTDAYLTPASA